MDDYLTVLSMSSPVDTSGLQQLARYACLELHRTQWLRCYLAADGARMICWYRAPDAESVRRVLRQQGSAEASVAAADVTGVDPAGIVEPRDRVAVEFSFEPPLPAEQVASMQDKLVDLLDGAGYAISRIFASRQGTRLVCLVDAAEEHSVTRCLQSAAVTPTAAWRCAELDPVPPKLFQSNAPQRPAVAARDTAHRPHRNTEPGGNEVPATDILDAVVIGAGIGGIGMLERLVRMGLRARVYESGSDVGGVWYWNRYPGARIDSEVYTYGFSFSDKLVHDWDWQELFAPRAEIWRYLQHVVDRFDLRRHMRFDARATAAAWDDRRNCWVLETGTGERVAARFLIAASGTLSTPQLPDYPGTRNFAGESHHTARWPDAGIDLAGKRVGVIGTGATGVQVIQTIAAEVRHLTVFQRTPTYCIPQRNHRLSDEERNRIRRDWQGILAACNESYGGFIHTFDPRSGLAVSAAEREAKFEELWQKPGFAFWLGNFGDLMMNPEVNAHASEFLRRKIRERVHDAEVASKLLPDHPLGTKRVPLENGYYEVYNRDNVRLVDLRESPIERITKSGVVTTTEKHALDVIINATGFDAGTGALVRIDIRGERGAGLAEKWQPGPRTYLGLLVSGFPNMFIVNGPQNAAALCNAGRCIEQNVDWIARCINFMRTTGATCINPTAAAEEEWTEHVENVAEASVLREMTDSWFFGANTPGKARRVNIYAAGAHEYRKICEEVAHSGYPGLTIT